MMRSTHTQVRTEAGDGRAAEQRERCFRGRFTPSTRRLTTTIHLCVQLINEEARLGDEKRRIARDALALKLGALLELGERQTVVSEMSRVLVSEIPQDKTEPGQNRVYYDSMCLPKHVTPPGFVLTMLLQATKPQRKPCKKLSVVSPPSSSTPPPNLRRLCRTRAPSKMLQSLSSVCRPDGPCPNDLSPGPCIRAPPAARQPLSCPSSPTSLHPARPPWLKASNSSLPRLQRLACRLRRRTSEDRASNSSRPRRTEEAPLTTTRAAVWPTSAAVSQ